MHYFLIIDHLQAKTVSENLLSFESVNKSQNKGFLSITQSDHFKSLYLILIFCFVDYEQYQS